jgi:hypothetical protein
VTLLLPLLGGLWGRLAPYAIAALVGGALVVGIYQTGVRAERKRGEAAALRAEIATLTRDRDIARQAEADAAARAAALDAASRADRALLEEIRRAPPNPSCRLSERDARRLQRIGAGAGR